ncbi:MAG: hypothetical protein HY398_01365 [Candidatus Doudnabacteria bacterium]|nr:hypothetical protein [Candidatus Doudnabacteria bacterium]
MKKFTEHCIVALACFLLLALLVSGQSDDDTLRSLKATPGIPFGMECRPPTQVVINAPAPHLESFCFGTNGTVTRVELQFTKGSDMNDVNVSLFLDTDQNPKTGRGVYYQAFGLNFVTPNFGWDYVVDYSDRQNRNQATIRDLFGSVVGSFPVRIKGQILQLDIPLSVIEDDGNMQLAALVGSNQGYTSAVGPWDLTVVEVKIIPPSFDLLPGMNFDGAVTVKTGPNKGLQIFAIYSRLKRPTGATLDLILGSGQVVAPGLSVFRNNNLGSLLQVGENVYQFVLETNLGVFGDEAVYNVNIPGFPPLPPPPGTGIYLFADTPTSVAKGTANAPLLHFTIFNAGNEDIVLNQLLVKIANMSSLKTVGLYVGGDVVSIVRNESGLSSGVSWAGQNHVIAPLTSLHYYIRGDVSDQAVGPIIFTIDSSDVQVTTRSGQKVKLEGSIRSAVEVVPPLPGVSVPQVTINLAVDTPSRVRAGGRSVTLLSLIFANTSKEPVVITKATIRAQSAEQQLTRLELYNGAIIVAGPVDPTGSPDKEIIEFKDLFVLPALSTTIIRLLGDITMQPLGGPNSLIRFFLQGQDISAQGGVTGQSANFNGNIGPVEVRIVEQ